MTYAPQGAGRLRVRTVPPRRTAPSLDLDRELKRLELKPCPFCGSDSVELHPNDIAPGGASMATPGTAQYAHCNGCGAEGPQSDVSEREAVDAWNRRVSTQG